MHARELMTQPAITCHVNDPLKVAAQKMWDHDCGVLVVVNDDGKVTGMITDRDVCMAAYTQGRSLDEILVNTAMANHVVSAGLDDSVTAIEQLMATHQVRRIPIVDANQIPRGVLSLNDLAIEVARTNTRMKHGATRVAHTLAAMCRPRIAKPSAA